MFGSYAFSQQPIASASIGYLLIANNGQYALTGKSVSVTLAKKISLPNGSYAFSGQAVSLNRSLGLYGINGSYSYTGYNASFVSGHSLKYRYANYSLNGHSVALGYNTFRPDISIDQVIDSLASYLSLFTNAIIIRGNVNRTSAPDGDFIALTELRTKALNKPIETYSEYFENINEHNQIDIRIDFYGWELAGVTRSVHSSFRTLWSVQQFPNYVVPLFASEPVKLAYENTEDQYEQRWFMDVSLQYNPTVSVPQLSFSEVGDIALRPDALYPDIIFSEFNAQSDFASSSISQSPLA